MPPLQEFCIYDGAYMQRAKGALPRSTRIASKASESCRVAVDCEFSLIVLVSVDRRHTSLLQGVQYRNVDGTLRHLLCAASIL